MADDADDSLDQVAAAIADGVAVDWAKLAGEVTTPADRKRLANLRLIAAIADLHQALDVDPHPPSQDTTREVVVASSVPSSGERWGRYQLVEQIGAGSFGKVYRAWDPDLERELAVKILYSGSANARVRERVLVEGKQLARLRDPNVVSVLDVEEHGGQFGLCMELVDGETLDEVLKSRGTLNPREAMLVGQDVCRALVAAHGANLVHRDVKARNIMRDRTGRIVLMDFGAGREVEELERADPSVDQVGTPLYMAPEVLAGHAATFRSDIYSVGVLLYHLVTAKYPVVGRTLKEIRTAHMFGNREPISHRRTDLPPAFVRIVDRALAANPDQRYRSAAEMLDDLGEANIPAPVARPLRPVAIVLSVLAAAVVGITALGAVLTTYFNIVMGRSDIAQEGVGDWATWGARAFVMPMLLYIIALIVISLVTVFYRVVRSVYPRMGRLEARVGGWVASHGLDKSDQLARLTLLLTALLVAVTWWWYADLFDALLLFPNLFTAPLANLQRLSPAFYGEHYAYRLTWTWVVFACAVLWAVPAAIAIRRREPVNRLLMAGGGALTLIALLFLTFPYKMLSQNRDLEVALWEDSRCYVIGERGSDLRLFCPERDPRSQAVDRADPNLRRTGMFEDPFTLFSPSNTQ
jgi:tRNA A-37 threonylcarbamoyl transferase component Bud32